MSEELLYTSAPQGLQPGSRGFCTVVRTGGLPKLLGERLESLSGYRHAFPPHSTEASRNPVNFSHLILTLSGRRYHVLSRIADAGLDYTGRSNKLAHHVALDSDELVPAGPAGVLAADRFCETSWDGRTRELPSGRRPTQSAAHTGSCVAWRAATGDAGWAGVLAEAALGDGSPAISVIVRADQPTLPLVVEANGLLPESRRWDVTFSTYFTRLPAGVDCQWRFLLDGTPEARAARRGPPGTVIDLCRSLPAATGGLLVEQARTGLQPASEPHEAVTSDTAPRRPSPVKPVVESPARPVPVEPRSTPNPPVRSPDEQFASTRSSRSPAVLAGVAATLLLVAIGAAAWMIGGTREPANRPGQPPTVGPGVVERPASEPVPADEQRPFELTARPSNPPQLPPVGPRPKAPSRPIPPRPVEPRPLDVVRLDRYAELPPGGGLSTPAGSIELLSLAVEPARCELRLGGSERLLGGGRTLELDRSDAAGGRRWDVRLTARNAKALSNGKLIGSFRLADGKLTFGWRAGAAGAGEAALRRSLLFIRIGDDSEHVFLSRPKMIDPVSLDVSRAETVQPVPLDAKLVAATDLRYEVALDGLHVATGYVDGRHLALGAVVRWQISPTPRFTEPDITIDVKLVLQQNVMKGLELHVSLLARDSVDAFPGLTTWRPVWRAPIMKRNDKAQREGRVFELDWTRRVLDELRAIEQRLRIHLRCFVLVGRVEMVLLKTKGWDELARPVRRGPTRAPSANRPAAIPQEPGA